MAEEKELARLEGFVSTLLDKFNALRADHKALTERLQRRDISIEDLRDELASLKGDRSEVSSRVSSLISQIEDWETDNGSEGEMGEADADTEDEKKDSAVQGNLFSAENADE